MSGVTNTIHNGMVYSEVLIEDLLSLLRKIAEQMDENKMLKKFEKEVLEDNKGVLFTLDDAVYGRTVKELRERGIPFCAYDVKEKTQKCIIVSERRKDEMARILTSVRVRVGQTVDNKQELDAALWESEIHPREYAITSLSGAMAEKIKELCDKHNIVSAIEEQGEGKYGVYAQVKNKKELQKFAFTAAWDLTGTNGERECKRLNYDLNERAEIAKALEKADSIMDKAYIFSAKDPNYYIQIEETGFTIHKDGCISATIYQNGIDDVDYEEFLKLRIREMEEPIYMTNDEVEEKGGPGSTQILQEIEDSRFNYYTTKEDGYTIQIEKALRNYIEVKLDVGNNGNLQSVARELPYINISDFKQYYREKMQEKEPDQMEYREELLNYLDKAEDHLKQSAAALREFTEGEIAIERPIDIAIEVAEQQVIDNQRQENIRKKEKQEKTI